jgi:hypothetical protein
MRSVGAQTRLITNRSFPSTSRKIAGSIPDDVIGFFLIYLILPCTVALELTQPLTEVSTSNLLKA